MYTIVAATFGIVSLFMGGASSEESQAPSGPKIRYQTVDIDGLSIFYREAGDPENPAILLLHGFPTSSRMYSSLMNALSDRYYLVAPDYPGYGYSSMPSVDEFDYTFDRISEIVESFTEKLNLRKYSMYLMDYGAPVGFRLAVKHPERVESLIIQNGNAYEEGLREFWEPLKSYWSDRSEENEVALRKLLTIDATKWQYTHGTRDEEHINPENWMVDQHFLDRRGNAEIQLAMFYDYGSNPGRYPRWQEYLRTHQPPTLIVWGKNDYIFPAEGAYPYKRDLKDIEFHLLDTGHFALEEDASRIARYIDNFLKARTE